MEKNLPLAIVKGTYIPFCYYQSILICFLIKVIDNVEKICNLTSTGYIFKLCSQQMRKWRNWPLRTHIQAKFARYSEKEVHIFYITKWGYELTLVTTHIFWRLEVERMSFFGGSFVFFPHFDRLVSFTSNKPWTSDVVGNSIYTSFAIQWACNNKVFKVKSSFHATVEPESIEKKKRANKF